MSIKLKKKKKAFLIRKKEKAKEKSFNKKLLSYLILPRDLESKRKGIQEYPIVPISKKKKVM